MGTLTLDYGNGDRVEFFGVSEEDAREAIRSDVAMTPYSVTESDGTVTYVNPRSPNRPARFASWRPDASVE